MRIAFLGDAAFIGNFDCTVKSVSEIQNYFQDVINILDTCDFSILNLETPLTSCKKTREAKSIALKSPAENVQLLNTLGISAVCLANNHIYDFGFKGVSDTIANLEKACVGYFGIGGKSILLQKDHERVQLHGFCCYTSNGWHYDRLFGKGQLNTFEIGNILRAIQTSKAELAYPILSVHWGEENTHYPNRNHIDIADSILSQYRTTIIGHHPHVMQGISKYENGLVAYSLGNFCFDDCVSLDGKVHINQTSANREGMILILTIENGQLKDYEVKTFVDNGKSIQLNNQLQEKIHLYSNAINEIENHDKYDNLRESEILEARNERLGRRDLRWLIDRMHINYILAVVQRKINQKSFKKVVKDFRMKSYE